MSFWDYIKGIYALGAVVSKKLGKRKLKIFQKIRCTKILEECEQKFTF